MIGSVNRSVKVLVMGSVRGLVMVSVTYSHHSGQMYQGSEVSKNPHLEKWLLSGFQDRQLKSSHPWNFV